MMNNSKLQTSTPPSTIVGAILIPVTRSELARLKVWLTKCPNPGSMNYELFFSIDDQWTEGEKQSVLGVIRTSNMRNAQRITFIDCDIPPGQSFYQKNKNLDFDINIYPYGLKSGPNLQFFTTFRKLITSGPNVENVLQLEVDAYPICSNWLTKLNCSIQWLGSEVLMAGSHPTWGETIGFIRTHINGNAVYFLTNSGFGEFLTFWEELLLQAVTIEPGLAYDVVLEWSYHLAKLSSVYNKDIFFELKRLMESEYKYKMISISNLIANLTGDENSCKSIKELEDFLECNPELLIVHGKLIHKDKDIIQDYFWGPDSVN